MKIKNFKRCFVNGKKSAVVTYDNEQSILQYFGESLGAGKGYGAVEELRKEVGTFNGFTNYLELSGATTDDIQSAVPGAVVEWQGTESYNARVAAAVGSRGGRKPSSSSSEEKKEENNNDTPGTVTTTTPAAVVATAETFVVPTIKDCAALHALICNMSGVMDAVSEWAVSYSTAKLTDETVTVDAPDCITQLSAFLPTVVDAFAAYAIMITDAVKEYQEKQAAARAAREAAEKAAAAAAVAAANGKTIVNLPDGSTVEVSGKVHSDFRKVCQLVKRGLNVYIYGASGTGKTHLCRQIAEALCLDFYSDQKISDDFQLKGFVDSFGKFQETELYKAVVNGGVYMLDEFDASDENAAIVLNSLLANGYITFTGGGRVECHKDFHVIACGNTIGRGPKDEYTGRNCLDAATLDRFAAIELTYDESIELLRAGGDQELVNFIHEVRRAVLETGVSLLVTLRAIEIITAVKDCFTPVECLKMALFKGLEPYQVRQIANACNGSGVWFDALKELAA